MAMNEAKKRDFVLQVSEFLNTNSKEFQESGFSIEERLNELLEKSTVAKEAEVAQQNAQIEAKKATVFANGKLEDVYKLASATVSLAAGALGKDHELVVKLKKLRK